MRTVQAMRALCRVWEQHRDQWSPPTGPHCPFKASDGRRAFPRETVLPPHPCSLPQGGQHGVGEWGMGCFRTSPEPTASKQPAHGRTFPNYKKK